MPSTNFLKKAAGVASYYGFVPLESALKAHPKKNPLKLPLNLESATADNAFGNELCSLINSCSTSDIAKIERPVQLYHVSRSNKKERSSDGQCGVRFCLTMLGVEKSVAEALILRTAFSILEDTGTHEGCVHINSIGDKDSVNRFSREISNYLRKNINDIPSYSRELFKKDVFGAFNVLCEKKHPLAENAPQPIQYLTDSSRRHLREVLEFLEVSNIPYEINSGLLGNRKYHSRTLFEIHRHDDDTDITKEKDNTDVDVLARGGRCDDFTSKLFRTNLPLVSIVIESRDKMRAKWAPPRTRKPTLYFIQLGARAKLRSLPVIEMLRKACIPIRQAIGNDSFAVQLEEALSLKVPHTIIMGQREALDKTVIVRDMGTHAQTIVSVSQLEDYLKSIAV